MLSGLFIGPWLKGYHAALEGKSPNSNPFFPNTYSFRAYDTGYSEGFSHLLHCWLVVSD